LSKITVELEVTDELAEAVAHLNGGGGKAQNHEVQEWAKQTLEGAAEDIIDAFRLEQEEGEPS
jgi:hypothetical protein